MLIGTCCLGVTVEVIVSVMYAVTVGTPSEELFDVFCDLVAGLKLELSRCGLESL
jgi:hypothetical protein